MTQNWTIRRILEWTSKDLAVRGIHSARLDSEILLAHALGVTRLNLYLDLDRPLTAAERDRFRPLVRRRQSFEPVAYILGVKEFYGRSFAVSRDVLVPRPETELMVERALALVDSLSVVDVVDIGTGTGAVGLTLAAEREGVQVLVTDISEAALAVARRNTTELGLDERVRTRVGDLFEALDEGTQFDLIVSNPPYIASGERGDLPPDVRDHEPPGALLAGPDGLAVITRLVREGAAFLRADGTMLIEIGEDQGPSAKTLATHHGWSADVHPDLSGRDRLLELRRET